VCVCVCVCVCFVVLGIMVPVCVCMYLRPSASRLRVKNQPLSKAALLFVAFGIHGARVCVCGGGEVVILSELSELPLRPWKPERREGAHTRTHTRHTHPHSIPKWQTLETPWAQHPHTLIPHVANPREPENHTRTQGPIELSELSGLSD
jgi:hypothetical protein